MNEIEELRRWSAEKVMGWKLANGYYLDEEGEQIYTEGIISVRREPWFPDDPRTGQIWLIVDKMRELGWTFRLFMWGKWDGHSGRCEAQFNYGGNTPIGYAEHETNPCLAILKAAKAALEGGDTK